jgi:hypothetical protein
MKPLPLWVFRERDGDFRPRIFGPRRPDTDGEAMEMSESDLRSGSFVDFLSEEITAPDKSSTGVRQTVRWSGRWRG